MARKVTSVLWAYRTTARTPTGETPFNLTYVTEVVIPIGIKLISLRKEFFDEHSNDD